MNYIVCMILYIQYTQSKRWAPRLGRLCIIEYIRRLSLLFQLEYIYTGMLAHLSNPAGILEDTNNYICMEHEIEGFILNTRNVAS